MSPALMVKSTFYVAKKMTSLQSIITLTDPGNIFLDRELLIIRAFYRMPQHLIQQNAKDVQIHFHPLSNIMSLEDSKQNPVFAGANVYFWGKECNNDSLQTCTPVLVSKRHPLKESFITFKSKDYARAVVAWREPFHKNGEKDSLKAVIVTNPYYAEKIHNYLTSLIYAK